MISSIFGGLHDFFDSGTWDVIRTVGVFFLIILWGATVYWVRKDARRRIESRPVIWLVTLLGAVPPLLGPLVYMLFRPPEYLEDVRERELEIRAIEKRLSARECPVCRADIEPEFLVCPVCSTRLRQSCSNCKRPLEPTWQVCPYCETPTVEAEGPVTLRPKIRPRTQRKAR